VRAHAILLAAEAMIVALKLETEKPPRRPARRGQNTTPTPLNIDCEIALLRAHGQSREPVTASGIAFGLSRPAGGA
jgi:hypothetical protein